VPLEKPRRHWNWRPWNGWLCSTTTDCSARLGIFHLLKLR
jgi:hypothetical protein